MKKQLKKKVRDIRKPFKVTGRLLQTSKSS